MFFMTLRFPDSIISRIFESAPSSTCLKLGNTCKNYKQIKLRVKGCPIAKATFKGHGSNFDFVEEEKNEISFLCEGKCFQKNDVLEALKNMNFDNCELTLIEMNSTQIHQMIESVRSIKPIAIKIQNCEMNLDDFKLLTTSNSIKAIAIIGKIFPPPDFDYILKKTESATFICLDIENLKCPDDSAYKLLYKWNRKVELECFKLYNLPKAVNLTDYANFLKQYVNENARRFTFVFDKDAGPQHLKENISQLDSAGNINGDIGVTIEKNGKLTFTPIFMFLRGRSGFESCTTRYGLTTHFY